MRRPGRQQKPNRYAQAYTYIGISILIYGYMYKKCVNTNEPRYADKLYIYIYTYIHIYRQRDKEGEMERGVQCSGYSTVPDDGRM